MPTHETGVNPHDAYGTGVDAEQYAAGFNGLHADFNDALEAAKAACADAPEVTGWVAYGTEQAEAIAEVEAHGVSLAENVQGGASEAANTDGQSSEEFVAVDMPPSRPVNFV